MDPQNARPTVSVVMPVYNAALYLSEAIDSIVTQSFSELELIIVDDGSTDFSRAIAEQWAERDGRIRILEQKHSGIIDAQNLGIEHARGPLIARMDADDISASDRLEKQVNHLNANPDIAAVGSNIRLVDPKGALLTVLEQYQHHEEIDTANLTTAMACAICNVTMRRDLVQRVGGFRHSARCFEDLDLFLRLAEISKLSSLPNVLLNYRQHLSSLCHTNYTDRLRCYKNVIEDTHQRRQLPPPKWESWQFPRQVSAGDHLKKWGWWALGSHNVASARHYAAKAMLQQPASAETWKLAFCALRGY